MKKNVFITEEFLLELVRGCPVIDSLCVKYCFVLGFQINLETLELNVPCVKCIKFHAVVDSVDEEGLLEVLGYKNSRKILAENLETLCLKCLVIKPEVLPKIRIAANKSESLEVSECEELEYCMIVAPQLLTFCYSGQVLNMSHLVGVRLRFQQPEGDHEHVPVEFVRMLVGFLNRVSVAAASTTIQLCYNCSKCLGMIKDMHVPPVSIVQHLTVETWTNVIGLRDILSCSFPISSNCDVLSINQSLVLFFNLAGMSDNGSVPSPPMKDSDHLFGPSEIGPKFAYEAGIRRKIISNNDMFPEWAGHVRRLRACELEEGGSLCNHILEMMNYMNKLEYLDTNFDRNLAVPLLLRSLPDSYNDFLWKNHCENKSKTWIEIINELRRYEEDKITQKGKLEEEKGKEKRKEKHYALDAQVGSSKRRKSCSWRDLGNGERKCPKNIEESIGSSS
ncbi:hypothetical protein OROHE_007850 [Orobanche hederae]